MNNILRQIKATILNFLRIKKFISYEFKKNRSLGFKSILRNWSKGFLSISEIIYDFPKNPYSKYVSDWVRIKKLSKINGKREMLVNDKLFFAKYFKDHPNVPQIIGMIKNKKIFFENHSQKLNEFSSETLLRLIIREKKNIIIKPLSGGGGREISKIMIRDNAITFTGHIKNEESFYALVNSNNEYVIQKLIEQNGYANKINPFSLNTIRIITMIDPDTNAPFIARAIHRFGTQKSGIVDNWTAGGISVHININNGELGLGANYPYSGDIKWLKSHPDTKIDFYQFKIPNWLQIKDSILQMAKSIDFIKYIGWDIVPMENDFLVLEANSNSDLNLIQIHGGLLSDERIAKFFHSNKII